MPQISKLTHHCSFLLAVQKNCILVGDSSVCRSRVRKEPLGVVAAISAWNYPLLIAAIVCI